MAPAAGPADLEGEVAASREQLLDAFQEATAAFAELMGLRRWEWRSREHLTRQVRLACQRADEARDRHAELVGGYVGEPTPLAKTLEDMGREVYGRRVDLRRRWT